MSDRLLFSIGGMNCARCQDTRWTCEEHSDQPIGHEKAPAPPLGFEVAENVKTKRSKPPSSDDNVIELAGRVVRKRWHK